MESRTSHGVRGLQHRLAWLYLHPTRIGAVGVYAGGRDAQNPANLLLRTSSCRSAPILRVIAVSISPCVIRHFRTVPSDISSSRAVSLMLRRFLYSFKTSSVVMASLLLLQQNLENRPKENQCIDNPHGQTPSFWSITIWSARLAPGFRS